MDTRKTSRLSFIHVFEAALLFAALLAFQNCSKVRFYKLTPHSEQLLSTADFTINNGAPFTSDISVTVQIHSRQAAQMYITNVAGCASGGSWEPVKRERPWVLGQNNTRATVYAKFKTVYGTDLPCTDANIIHDDIAPEVGITEGPGAFDTTGNARHSFYAADDGSGVEHIECRTGTGQWTNCDSPSELRDLTEGPWQFLVRAVDRAGNISDPVDNSWLIDKTAPSIAFTEVPAPLSNKSTALFRFEAADGASGVAAIACQLDTENAAGSVQSNCSSPTIFADLGSPSTEVKYRFWVWAFDHAGNQSAKISYDFIVDRAASGAFEVSGVTGGGDTVVDNLLGTVPTPTVHWTPSAMAEVYRVSILDESGTQVICAEAMTSKASLNYSFSAQQCTLMDGKKYRARVVAEDGVGNIRTTPLFLFTVDLTPPSINITGPSLSNEDKDARFQFSINDPSGINAATCEKASIGINTNPQASDCKNKTELTYTNVTPGEHTFRIIASDNAGNTATSRTINWVVNKIVCDPFSNMEQLCRKGLKGNLWYLSEQQRLNPFTQVDRYINEGVKANVLIYMAQLFIPTKPWTTGFVATDGTVIKDNSGQTLFEYFALQFETLVKLDPSLDREGKYQFAILSDDGSVVEIKDTPAAPWRTFINNDGNHPTQLGCDLQGVTLNTASRVPMRIKYYQGPRRHIALTLLWRPFPTDTAAVNDPLCGQPGNNERFFGPVDTNPPNFQDFGYGELVKRGWKPLTPANFILDEVN